MKLKRHGDMVVIAYQLLDSFFNRMKSKSSKVLIENVQE